VTAALIGYTDRISVRSGEKISFKISSAGPTPYHAMLVRIVRGDPNPGGPPPKFEDMSDLFYGRFASRVQHAWPGSYGLVEGAKDVELPGALQVEALIWPTLPEDGPQTVISRRDPATGAGFALVLTPEGMALESGTDRVCVGKKLRARIWYRVWASADPETGMLRVGQQPLVRAFATDDEGEASGKAPELAVEAMVPLMIGAEAATDRPARRCFNGKIEAPRIPGFAAWDLDRKSVV
jgi:N,N-dimethylformamidase